MDKFSSSQDGYNLFPIAIADSDIEKAWMYGTLEELIRSLIDTHERLIREYIDDHLRSRGLKK